MPAVHSRTRAGEALAGFSSYLASRQFADITQRIRRHFIEEFLEHAQLATGTARITGGRAAGPGAVDAWLADAAAGKTRTRNTLHGPEAAAGINSMRVRIDSYNAFAEFAGLPDRRDSQPPADADRLTAAQADRLLRDLAARRPAYANAATALRTAAVVLVADTGRSVPDLAGLKITALHLDDPARIELADGPYPLRGTTVLILTRWLAARAEIIAELEGSDPGHLWIPVKPGRPRGGRPPVKPGLTPAAVRTLHAAHRRLVSHVLGTPLRPGALRGNPIDIAGDGAQTQGS